MKTKLLVACLSGLLLCGCRGQQRPRAWQYHVVTVTAAPDGTFDFNNFQKAGGMVMMGAGGWSLVCAVPVVAGHGNAVRTTKIILFYKAPSN